MTWNAGNGWLGQASFDSWDGRGGRALLSLPALTFARASTKVALTGAPTDGSTGFVQSFGSGVMALENRGDGAGPLVLIEASFTNAIFQSRDVSNAAWTGATGTPTVTGNAGPGIDGGTTAARIQCTSAQAKFQGRASGATVGNPECWSGWVRRFSSGGDITLRCAGSTDVSVHDASGTTTYERLVCVPNSSGGADNNFASDGRPFTAAQDCLGDYYQLEVGRYPHSVIATAGAGATSLADSLTATAVPSWMLAAAHTIPQVSPVFANTDLVSGDIRWLWTIASANDGVRIRHTGASVVVEAVVGGVVKASSGALTFARHALLGAVRVDPIAAVISVGGVAGSAGTPWAWSTGAFRVGGISGGSGSEFDGRVASTWYAG